MHPKAPFRESAGSGAGGLTGLGRSPLLHPFVFGFYPVIFFYAQNSQYFPFQAIFRPAVASLLVTALALVVLGFLGADRHMRGLFVSTGILLTAVYGPVQAVAGSRIPILLSDRLLVVVFGALWVLVCLGFWRSGEGCARATPVANAVALAMVALPVAQVTMTSLARTADPPALAPAANAMPTTLPADAPDIYYIVLDGYGRADVLEDLYAIDNGPWLRALEERGFYVAAKSRANYPQTQHSLAASLNMGYLDGLAEGLGRESRDREPLRRLIYSSEVLRLLRGHGYTFVTFATSPDWMDIQNAEFYLGPSGVGISDFELGLINTTALRPFLERIVDAYGRQRVKIEYVLENIGKLGALPAPKFVFAHLLAPHPPFVFAADGSPIAPDRRYSLHDSLVEMTLEEYVTGYRDEIEFLNRSLERAVDEIISSADRPVVIVMQGDHGPGSTLSWEEPGQRMMDERFPILNAYRLPDDGNRLLYPEISPVNTFRVVFNHYFAATYPLLEDASYFSDWNYPFDFSPVTPATETSTAR